MQRRLEERERALEDAKELARREASAATQASLEEELRRQLEAKERAFEEAKEAAKREAAAAT